MSNIPTSSQVSAGGVPFRQTEKGVEVALISVGEEARWQLPKGLLGRGEAPVETALREVREETGLEATIVGTLDTIEYWYYSSTKGGKRIRFHKYVHYFLMRYESGDTADHDWEVNEARWFDIDEAVKRLEYKNEKDVLRQAREAIEALS
jgi:8-oxo-dGTP pyrophosphatase MutT (NUDIX family)